MYVCMEYCVYRILCVCICVYMGKCVYAMMYIISFHNQSIYLPLTLTLTLYIYTSMHRFPSVKAIMVIISFLNQKKDIFVHLTLVESILLSNTGPPMKHQKLWKQQVLISLLLLLMIIKIIIIKIILLILVWNPNQLQEMLQLQQMLVMIL